MITINSFKEEIFSLINVLNIFRKDSIQNKKSIKKTAIEAIALFSFLFFITFSKKESFFNLNQTIVNIFYTKYEAVEFYKIFNYSAVLFFAVIINMAASLITTLFFTLYLRINKGFYYRKDLKLFVAIFLQSSKCFSFCGVIAIFAAQIIYMRFLELQFSNNISPLSFFSVTAIPFMSFSVVSFFLLSFGIVKPIATFQEKTFETYNNKFFAWVDRNFPFSLMLFLLALGLFFIFEIDFSIKIASKFDIINSEKFINNECIYLVLSPQTPPAIKFAYRQSGCDRYDVCMEMPDASVQNACLEEIFRSSSDFKNLSQNGKKDYCKLS